MRDGRYGWWWDVDGAWYFYEQPVYPYPAAVSDVEALEEAADAEPPAPPPPPLTPGGIIGGIIGGAINNTLSGFTVNGNPVFGQ
jgi:hypothetical protein